MRKGLFCLLAALLLLSFFSVAAAEEDNLDSVKRGLFPGWENGLPVGWYYLCLIFRIAGYYPFFL